MDINIVKQTTTKQTIIKKTINSSISEEELIKNKKKEQEITTNNFEKVKILRNKILFGDYYEGIKKIFEENPKLIDIGNKEEYNEYLNTIFLDSEVKDILLHTSNTRIEEFDKKYITGNGSLGDGFYFSDLNSFYLSEDAEKHYVILNIKKLKRYPGLTFGKEMWKVIKEVFNDDNSKQDEAIDFIVESDRKNDFDGYCSNDNGDIKEEYMVFEPNQIHILGSKKDLNGFNNFIDKKI